MMKRTERVEESVVRRKTVTSFLVFGLLTGLVMFGWWKLYRTPQSDGSVRPQLRRVFEANEKVARSVFGKERMAKTYPLSAAVKNVRVNGRYGLAGSADTSSWRLRVARSAGDSLVLSLNDIRKLPKTEIVFDFKCIEGWDQVTHWGGVRFADFVKHYSLRAASGRDYTGLSTPDGQYYVGIDHESMMHPQTLLCYEVNGKPLPQDQGFPLRLIIPVKYGIKHLKRIGTVYFSDAKPRDYWAERGYDYHSGH
jgi:DMSO/TMAO reductase YedYZ molybdopterin-dependent catalytic subunit